MPRTPHDCVQETNIFIEANLTVFVDGSYFRDATGNHTGNAIVQLNGYNSFSVIKATKIAQLCSAQLAEIKALTATCKLAAGKRLLLNPNSPQEPLPLVLACPSKVVSLHNLLLTFYGGYSRQNVA